MAVNDTFTSGQVLTATEMNNLPFGLVGASTATATTTFTAATALQVLTLTITIVPNRRYRICGQCGIQPTSAASSIQILYVTATGFTSQTLVYDGHSLPQNFNYMLQGSTYATAADFGVTTGSGTSKTLSLYLDVRGANGALTTNPDNIVGAGSVPQKLWVEDIGSA